MMDAYTLDFNQAILHPDTNYSLASYSITAGTWRFPTEQKGDNGEKIRRTSIDDAACNFSEPRPAEDVIVAANGDRANGRVP